MSWWNGWKKQLGWLEPLGFAVMLGFLGWAIATRRPSTALISVLWLTRLGTDAIGRRTPSRRRPLASFGAAVMSVALGIGIVGTALNGLGGRWLSVGVFAALFLSRYIRERDGGQPGNADGPHRKGPPLPGYPPRR